MWLLAEPQLRWLVLESLGNYLTIAIKSRVWSAGAIVRSYSTLWGLYGRYLCSDWYRIGSSSYTSTSLSSPGSNISKFIWNSGSRSAKACLEFTCATGGTPSLLLGRSASNMAPRYGAVWKYSPWFGSTASGPSYGSPLHCLHTDPLLCHHYSDM